jgi:dTDP-4-dehydrorhamnose 3,5-epimerase-like enzyme
MQTQNLGIDGVGWHDTYWLDNGGDSVVVPFPTTDLVHLVFHGEDPFSHGHYGYHVGLEDWLTFLGPPEKVARGFFVDCRRGSLTLHKQLEVDFTPSVRRTLRIPCGVAHCFEGLEGVYTLNTFRAYLPPPEMLMTEKSPWATGADIFNFPLNSSGDEFPVVDPNPYPASQRFYELLSAMQAETLGTVDHEYPYTQTVVMPDGSAASLMIRKPLSAVQQVPEWEPVDGIAGLGWRRHLVVWSGEVAGYAALTDTTPIQVIDHGTDHYATDAYGLHVEWEDRLTFVGPMAQKVRMTFIDCRENSPTWHREAVLEFHPSPLRYLVIPAGVAHALDGMENVFTINRARRCAGDTGVYEPGNDVIDWPLNDRPAPTVAIEDREFSYAYYAELAARQREYLASTPGVGSTPTVLLVDDGSGDKVRIAIRKVADIHPMPT